jgi:hypothetical protein
MDDALCLPGKWGSLRRQEIRGGYGGVHARAEAFREETGEGDFSETYAAIAEEVPAGEPKGGML